MDPKGEPTLPQVATHRRPCPPRFRKFSTYVGVVLSLLLFYDVSRLGVARTFKVLQHSCSGGNRSFDSYINRVEDIFLTVPSTESAIANSRRYATYPHLAGSEVDLKDAKDVLLFFQNEFGISQPSIKPIFNAGSPESRHATLSTTSDLKSPNAWIDVYYPAMNTGNADGISLEILGQDGKSLWTANLLEDGDPADETAEKYKHAIPPWHGLSAGGEAAGPIVYANYGTKDDYNKLVAMGVDLTGKIVLARYGANFRGLKIKGVQDHGVVGILIYSDPRDDGAVIAENGYLPYPAGPARNPTSIQRGSVQFLSTYPGDPTTPGYPAYENATRTESGNLPISLYLFERELGGVQEGRKLDGKLGDHVVRMVNDVDTKVMPIWNAMAAIPGHIKVEVVILGCYRDAWVMGAADPVSGTVSLLELVRGLGTLVKRGWKPLRTLVIASWDAEEFGLIRSTEWGEDFARWIQAHAVSYVDVDVSVVGSRYTASGSPSLAHLIKRNAQDVAHPTEQGKTVWDAIHDSGPYTGEQDAEFANTRTHAASEDDVRSVSPLGSRSDFTVFLQRLGVASSDQSFIFTPTDAAYHYHSIYDSQMWQETYADPGFNRHVALTKTLGLLALRLSNSIILPLNTTKYARQLDSYVDTVREAASGVTPLPDLCGIRGAISSLQQASAKLDVEKVDAEKAFYEAVGNLPHIEFSALHVLSTMWDVTEENLCEGPICDLIRAAIRVKRVNQKLSLFERGFISEEGIKDREWFRHLGVAPGKYLGYGATVLPALSEAILYEHSVTLVEYGVVRLTTLLTRLAKDTEP